MCVCLLCCLICVATMSTSLLCNNTRACKKQTRKKDNCRCASFQMPRHHFKCNVFACLFVCVRVSLQQKAHLTSRAHTSLHFSIVHTCSCASICILCCCSNWRETRRISTAILGMANARTHVRRSIMHLPSFLYPLIYHSQRAAYI